MSEQRNGGPAFPCDQHNDYLGTPQGASAGMSLRDYFAAKAMQALLTALGPYEDEGNTGDRNDNHRRENAYCVETLAAYAYEQADAMLKARQS